MKCLIIAAGKGKRLSNICNCKPLIPVYGTALIERVISYAHIAGITQFFVVIGYNAEKVKNHLNSISKREKIKIHFIYNNKWNKENGVSVLKAKNHMKEKFVLLMADHIFDPNILLKLKNQYIQQDEIILAVDSNTINNPYVDMEDVTKVQVENGLIVNIGKNIKNFNAFDTGIFLCTSSIFCALQKSIQAGDSTLSGGIRILASNQKARVIDINDNFWIDVDDEKALQKAEHIIQTLKNSYSK